ncbi:hypothetical protein Q1695_008032 [Nippostrongylus brasiliensis]|nr:hypothetical protein Q1695_008032 [Nippostrongylus brasiliensis]
MGKEKTKKRSRKKSKGRTMEQDDLATAMTSGTGTMDTQFDTTLATGLATNTADAGEQQPAKAKSPKRSRSPKRDKRKSQRQTQTQTQTQAEPTGGISVELPAPAARKAKSRGSSPKKSTQTKKTLTSRPIRERSLIEMAAKVRKRKEPKYSTVQTQKSVDEDAFPRAAPKKGKKKRGTKKKNEEIFVPRIDSAWLLPDTSVAEKMGGSIELEVRPTATTLPGSGLPIVTGNKDNDGMLMVGGQPFWATTITPDETDDELVMNAAVLIDVLENRLKLQPMPDIEIVLDPMEETTVLAARDRTCYTKEVLFGNTVRSMVNLNELSIRALSIKGRKKQVSRVDPEELKQLNMEVPTMLNTYYRKTYNRFKPIPFTPTAKKPPANC